MAKSAALPDPQNAAQRCVTWSPWLTLQEMLFAVIDAATNGSPLLVRVSLYSPPGSLGW